MRKDKPVDHTPKNDRSDHEVGDNGYTPFQMALNKWNCLEHQMCKKSTKDRHDNTEQPHTIRIECRFHFPWIAGRYGRQN
jgi:hypothetical protein